MDPVTAPLPATEPAPTMAAAVRARAADSAGRIFLRFEDQSWTSADTYREGCRFAQLFLKHRDVDRPFHVGVLMDNLPTFVFAQAGCALSGAALVGLNPTRSATFLARDIAYSDCQIVIVEGRYADQLRVALDDDVAARVHVFVTDGPAPAPWQRLNDALANVAATDPEAPVQPADLLMIIFTSGTTKAPKGVINSHGRLMMLGWGALMHMCKFRPADCVYSAMPLFHAN